MVLDTPANCRFPAPSIRSSVGSYSRSLTRGRATGGKTFRTALSGIEQALDVPFSRLATVDVGCESVDDERPPVRFADEIDD